MDRNSTETHLTDADLFALAVPAAGKPEALPRHLSGCQSCSRALQEWKGAVQTLAEEEVDAITRRPAEEWDTAAEATMARIRRSARPASRGRPLRWAVGIAASLLLLALAIPRHAGRSTATDESAAATATAARPDSSELSAADREDDRLLRDVAFLAQGEDAGSGLAADESL